MAGMDQSRQEVVLFSKLTTPERERERERMRERERERGRERQEVVLFSKLNTLKFPNPKEIIEYMKRVLAPARYLDFQVHVRKVPEGTPYLGGVASVEIGADEPVRSTTDSKGVVDLRLPLGKDFEVVAQGCDPRLLHTFKHIHIYISTVCDALFLCIAFAVHVILCEILC